MPHSPRALLSAVALMACAMAPAAHAEIVYSLASAGTRLIRFDTANPALVTTVGPISGGVGSLNGLDFRPANGLLYGYSNATNGIYTVNTATGAATFVSTLSVAAAAPVVGIDFNPVPDRLRIVNTGDLNLRVNVATGATTMDTALTYATGDGNAGSSPNIADVAYTNSDTDPATGTALYYLDSFFNSLATTVSPNDGVLNTVGLLGFDFSDSVGFDIGGSAAFAALNVGGVNSLYSLNLATGGATLLGAIGDFTDLNGLTIGIAAVPEPGSFALLGAAGLAAFGATRRRRTAVGTPAPQANLA